MALAGASNRSRYTRFSQAGGGDLDGFGGGAPGQYRVQQALVETALMYRGFSWQQEFHWKEIDDTVNGGLTTLLGNLVQFGYFFHHWWSAVPAPLETAFRYALFDPDKNFANDVQQEFSLAGNWFFNEHLNKVTAEISYFRIEENVQQLRGGFRFRLQWDVSL